jgi:CRP/FNR family transcriptional regulator, cyclic AMP receptor protein
MTMSLTTERKVPFLRDVALFDGIDPDGLAMIAERALEVDFAEGRPIVRQGEVGTGFFLVTSGGARVVRDGTTIAEYRPGDFFGELSLLDRGPRIASVVATAPTTCLAIASWDFEALLESQPRLAIAILKGVAGRLRTVSDEHRH